MWLIFVGSSLAIGLAALALVWIGNKVYLSMKRSQRKYEQENKKLNEKEKEDHEI